MEAQAASIPNQHHNHSTEVQKAVRELTLRVQEVQAARDEVDRCWKAYEAAREARALAFEYKDQAAQNVVEAQAAVAELQKNLVDNAASPGNQQPIGETQRILRSPHLQTQGHLLKTR